MIEVSSAVEAVVRDAAAIETERVVCNNCGSSKHDVVAIGRDHEYPHTTTARFAMVRCECGLLFLDPRPAVSELDRIYPPDYYAYQIIEQRQRQSAGKGSLLRRYMDARAIARLRAYTKLVTSEPPYRILDIGCGDGTILNQWSKAFDAPVETHGVEMNAGAAKIAAAQGHHVMQKRIEECELPAASYDFVFSFHVVEHVEDPAAFMRAIHGAMKPEGWLLIETPNVDTPDFRLFGRHWGAYHFPRHFNLYDAKTFGALAEKAGFEVVRVSYMPSAVFWIWTMHSMLFDKHPKLAKALFPPVDILLRGSPWIWTLMSTFTAVDMVNRALSGRTACMRILMKRRS